LGEDFSCPISGEPNCIAPSARPAEENYHFQYYENKDPYYGAFCDKINPYDLKVREASAEAIRGDSGSYNIDQLLDVYDWVKENIQYQSVPLAGIPYPPSDTLATKSGDCKNQAVLIASMIEAIGGNARVIVDPLCVHAYTIVYFANTSQDMQHYLDTISSHYHKPLNFQWEVFDGGNWMIFDPAGGNYPGDTLPECSGDRTIYSIDGCLSCAKQYPDMPYTLGDKCYSQCPSGTISTNDYACSPCPKGYYSFENECVTCQSGYYLATNGRCYKS
jgi:hypothetical protein